MALNPGRGAQVRLDGDAQKLARGGGAGRLDENAAAKAALERAGLSADGYSPDGSTVTGVIAEDEALAPGGVVPDIPTVTTIATNAANTAAASQVTALAIPKTGGTLTGPLVLSGAATTDLNPTTKLQLDTATITLPHSNSITGRSIPTAVTSVFVQGFSAQGDGGESGPWVVVASQPTHTAWRQSADGRFWELQTKVITPRAFGAKGDGTNQLTQITNMFAYAYSKYVGVFGDQFPNGQQPVIDWGPGRFRATGLTFSAVQTGVVWTGVPGATLLDGISFDFAGNRQTVQNLQFVDVRGITADTYGIKLTNAARRQARIHNVQIRDKAVGLWLAEGGVSNINQLTVERCSVGILATGAGDATLVNSMITANTLGFVNKGTGELKFVGGHIYNNDSNVLFEGDDRVNTLECYYTNVTMSNTAVNRVQPVIRVEDNGKGGARAILSENITISSAAAATAVVLERGQIWRPADTSIGLIGSGTLTALAVDGTSIISGTVTWTNVNTGATNIAANINAGTGTHGYTATSFGNRFWIFSPGLFNGAAANGRAVTWTLTAGTFDPRPHTKITTAVNHGFVVGDAVEFNTSGNAAFSGIGFVSWVDSPTEFTVTGLAVPFVSGKVAKAIRVQTKQASASTSGFSVSAYNQSLLSIADCGPGYVDLASGVEGVTVPFTTTSTGNLTVPGWGVQMISHDQAGRVNDKFINCGNINLTLISGGFDISFVGQRTKDMLWIDPPYLPTLGNSAIEKIGNGFGRNVTTARWNMPAGATYGWGYVGYIDYLAIDLLPSNRSGPGILAPSRVAGLSGNRAAAYNLVQATDTGVLMIANKTEAELLPGGFRLPGYTFATLPAPSSASGCTVRVTDRNNRLVTSDNTNWRDQNGTILT